VIEWVGGVEERRRMEERRREEERRRVEERRGDGFERVREGREP